MFYLEYYFIKTFFYTAISPKVSFICTYHVLHECLYKQRTNKNENNTILQSCFWNLLNEGTISLLELSIADLQEPKILNIRKGIGLGELSTLAGARKTNQAFLSDDDNACKLVLKFKLLPHEFVQTTPLLFGWLAFTEKISDPDKDRIIEDHKSKGRNLSERLEEAYLFACNCRDLKPCQ